MIEYEKVYDLTKKLTVLYVEDDKHFREETCEILNYFFTDITVAYDGQDGLEKYLNYFNANAKHFDIVITDIIMPQMDGVALIKAIYAHNNKQSTIVISAHDESNYLLELVNIGIEQFLQKPIDYDKVLEVLYNVSKKLTTEKKKVLLEETMIKLDERLVWNTEELILLDKETLVKLTKNETLLMQIFIKNRNKVSKYEEIYNVLWAKNPELASVEALLPLISRFRKKLPNNTIENIYSLGYRLNF